MQYIIYAVIVAQILTLIGAEIWYGILIKRKNVNRPIKDCVNVRTVLMCILAGIGLQLVIDFFLNKIYKIAKSACIICKYIIE